VVDRRRWLLAAAAAAVAMAAGAYLAVRDPEATTDDVRAEEAPESSTTRRSDDPATTVPLDQATTTAPSTTGTTEPPAAPPFESSVSGVTREELGASWRADLSCPAPEDLRKLTVSHWGYDGQVRSGELVVHAQHADRIVAVLRDVYAARFPIERMVPIAAYGGDDQASMRANNTSGFNCRYVAGTTRLSQHALGAAVDVNPLHNPYVKGGAVDPPEGAPWADRSRPDPGMIHAGDAVVQAFARQGWGWGGSWSAGQDYQHFSASGG
jgi:hypothetical protein